MKPIENDIPTNVEEAWEASNLDDDEIEEEKLVGVRVSPYFQAR